MGDVTDDTIVSTVMSLYMKLFFNDKTKVTLTNLYNLEAVIPNNVSQIEYDCFCVILYDGLYFSRYVLKVSMHDQDGDKADNEFIT